jgi:hypothetical protein
MIMGLFRRLARLATITTLLGGTAAVAAAASPAASAAPAAGPVGWVRIAHLSPEAPAMDMYLYPFGNPASPVVLKDVSYGNVSNGTVRYWNRPNTQPIVVGAGGPYACWRSGSLLACPPCPIRVPCLGSRREAGGTLQKGGSCIQRERREASTGQQACAVGSQNRFGTSAELATCGFSLG